MFLVTAVYFQHPLVPCKLSVFVSLMQKMADVICLPRRIFCECQWDVKMFTWLRLLSKGFFSLEIGGAFPCNSVVMILKGKADENKLTALLLNDLWLNECAVIAFLKNERAPVILHWKMPKLPVSLYILSFSTSFSVFFLTLINPQYISLLERYRIHSPEMLYTLWWRQHARYLSEILNQCLIQFWGRRWLLPWWSEAVPAWRRQVKCRQCSLVKLN